MNQLGEAVLVTLCTYTQQGYGLVVLVCVCVYYVAKKSTCLVPYHSKKSCCVNYAT